jgi:hypothetical protein
MNNSFDIWWHLSTQEPLYRNQEEFNAWKRSSFDVAEHYDQMYENSSDEEKYEALSLELEFYIGPAYEKLFGVKVRNVEDWIRRVASRTYESEQKAQSWSLNVPEDGKKFVEWMDDENTGKPVTARQNDRSNDRGDLGSSKAKRTGDSAR